MSECACDEFEDTSEDAMDTALIRAVLHVRKHERADTGPEEGQ